MNLGYHVTREQGCWYVASPSGQTIVAGPFPSHQEAQRYADTTNDRRPSLTVFSSEAK